MIFLDKSNSLKLSYMTKQKYKQGMEGWCDDERTWITWMNLHLLYRQTNNGFEADIKDFAVLKCPVLVQICSLVCCDKKMRTHYTVFIIFSFYSSINVILCQNQPTYRSDNSVSDDGRVAQASNRQNQNSCVCILCKILSLDILEFRFPSV